MCSWPKVAVLVPAYNEEGIIERTILSLMAQVFPNGYEANGKTHPFEWIMVIANNCNDRTVEIVEKLQQKFGNDVLRLEIMENNPELKAGALNHGYRMIDGDCDFVFGMDADTIVDSHIIEVGVKKFLRESDTGGICSAYRTIPMPNGLSRWSRFLWRLQNIEFSLANAWRIENYDSARVLPGVASMYRVSALKDVEKLHEQQGLGKHIVWVPNCQVEDYLLTLELKDLGWKAKSCHDMVSWSDVPFKLNGSGGLWRQRRRWYSGTIDVLRERGLKRHSRYELFTILLLVIDLPLRLSLVTAYILLLLSNHSIQIVPIFLLLPLLAIIMQMYRLLRFGEKLDGWQVFFTVTLVVNDVYAIYREILYTYSIYLSFRKPNRSW